MLKDFLDKKPLYYEKIDYTRMPRVYERVKSRLKTPKIIHLIGTNGKGTTGRFLATALCSLGFKTGHYTSPHIVNFNERVWFNGENVSDEVLDDAHKELLGVLTQEEADSLSYFEYTTLLAMWIYQECDYVVLEAGLGGEHDATAVFVKTLTLVTPIDRDHEAFLGDTISKIAKTKLNAVQNRAILANQNHKDVYSVAKELNDEKSIEFHRVDRCIDVKDAKNIKIISEKLSLAPYLEDNLKLAISALNSLDILYNVDNFTGSRLFGRLTQLNKNIVIDVGHNTLAASSILSALQGKKYVLIYNSFKDKNYKEILNILKPIISSIEIIEIVDERAEDIKVLEKVIEDLGIVHKIFARIDKNKSYLVFGSFSVVESFLNIYKAKSE